MFCGSHVCGCSVQQHGLAHPIDDVKADFKKLLETMAALYRLRVAGASQELMVDQLADLFSDLVAQKVFTRKQVDALDGVRLQLEELKNAAPAVKEAVAAVQEVEGKRIRNEIQAFTDGVNAHARAFRKCSFLAFATGVEDSYLSMDEEVLQFNLFCARLFLLCIESEPIGLFVVCHGLIFESGCI